MLTKLVRRNTPRNEMSFLEHLDDLRTSLLRVLAVFAVGMLLALIFWRDIPKFLDMPLGWAKLPATSPLHFIISEPCKSLVEAGDLIVLTFMDVWKMLMLAAFGAGIALASPVFLYEAARFVGPALTEREKRGIIPFCISAFILFIIGSTLAFLWLTPMSIQIMYYFSEGMGIKVLWQVSDYYQLVVGMSLLTGLTFQFPLALIILMWLELVRPRTLMRSWRGMLFGIMVLVGIITPVAEPFGLFAMTAILFSFYLAAVSIGTLIVRKKRVARGDKPNPEDDDLDEEDDEGDDDNDDWFNGSTTSKNPNTPTPHTSQASATPKAKSTPPPAEGDLSSLD